MRRGAFQARLPFPVAKNYETVVVRRTGDSRPTFLDLVHPVLLTQRFGILQRTQVVRVHQKVLL